MGDCGGGISDEDGGSINFTEDLDCCLDHVFRSGGGGDLDLVSANSTEERKRDKRDFLALLPFFNLRSLSLPLSSELLTSSVLGAVVARNGLAGAQELRVFLWEPSSLSEPESDADREPDAADTESSSECKQRRRLVNAFRTF